MRKRTQGDKLFDNENLDETIIYVEYIKKKAFKNPFRVRLSLFKNGRGTNKKWSVKSEML